jgi:hypothetical protein
VNDLTDSIVSPMLESARTITDASHVKLQPDRPIAEDELALWERAARDQADRAGTWLRSEHILRLVTTVRALQRDLAEARAVLSEVHMILPQATILHYGRFDEVSAKVLACLKQETK